MASPKKGSKIKRFLGGIGLIKEDKPKKIYTSGPSVRERESQRQSTPVPVRKTSVSEEVRKRASSVSETVQETLKSARTTISEPIEGKWADLRRKYSTGIKLEDITKFILDNPEQARSFLKKRSPGVFSKRNYHQEYLANPEELFKLYSKNPEIRVVIQDLYPPRLISDLQLKHHESFDRRSVSASHQESIYEEGLAELDKLSGELTEENAKREEEKAERDQLTPTPKSPLDELLDQIESGVFESSGSAKETSADFQQVSKEELDEILAPLNEEEKGISASTPSTDTNRQEDMDDLDDLLGGLNKEKAKRDEEKNISQTALGSETPSTDELVDEMDELLSELKKGRAADITKSKINAGLNEIVISTPINILEENPQQLNEIFQKIQNEDIKFDAELGKQFNDAKDLLSTKHTVVMNNKNITAMEDLQARYALFNQWADSLASIPGYESLREHLVSPETLSELQQAIEIAKLLPKEEEKSLDQLLRELVDDKPQKPMDSSEQKDVQYPSGVGDLEDLLVDLQTDKEVTRLIDKGNALIEKWETLNNNNGSEKDKRNFVREYEVYLRELDGAGKEALKSSITLHANKMTEVRASLPAVKINLRYEGELTASQGNVSDLAAKKAQEMQARQAHKTACLEALEKIEDVAYKNLLADAVSKSQQKGKQELPSIDVLNAFVEKANMALNSQEGLNANRHHALLDESKNDALNNLFSRVEMKSTYTSSAQAAKNAKPYEVRAVQPSASPGSLSAITSADLQAGMSRLKPISKTGDSKPQSLSEIIEKRKSEIPLVDNPALKK